MKKPLIIFGVTILVLVLIFGFFLFLHSFSPGTSSSTSTQSTSFPISQINDTNPNSSTPNEANQIINIKTISGASIAVKNFENSSSTVKDTSNNGYYYLSGGVNVELTKAPYQIFYDSQYNYFGITLYQEPLGQYRQQAELQLEQELGLTQDQLCNLNYDVSAGPGINDLYSSKNLGFSFCPNAVALPQ